MKPEVFILSVYPISREFHEGLQRSINYPYSSITIAELRQFGGFKFISELRRIAPDRLLLPMEDDNSIALIPIVKLLAFFTRAHRIELVHPSLAMEEVPRFGIIMDIFRLCFASISCFVAAGLAWFKLSRVLSLPRMDVSYKLAGREVLYLKTNLWFGIKAGGSVGHIAGVINALFHCGHQVTIASAEAPVMIDKEVNILKISPPKTFGVPYELNNFRFQIDFYNYINDVQKNNNISLIYQRLSPLNFLGVELSRRYHLPLVVEFNGSEVWIAKNWGRPLRFHKLGIMAENAMIKHAHLVVTISEVLRDELIEKGVEPSRIVCYPNCIDPKVFSPVRFTVESCKLLRKRYIIPVNATVIAFVGTFGQWHGAEVLAEAIAILWLNDQEWLQHNKVHFLFVGDGLKMPQVKTITNLAGADAICTFTGLIAQDQAPLHLAVSDILVSPHIPNSDGTRFFGSPTKLFEYMAMGKGIVASRLDQIGEVLSPALDALSLPEKDVSVEVEDENMAVLTTPGDIQQLIMGVKFLVERRDWREQIGWRARQAVLNKYTWHHHVEAILKTFEPLAKLDE